jgi:hypothetical protein
MGFNRIKHESSKGFETPDEMRVESLKVSVFWFARIAIGWLATGRRRQ